MGFARVRHSPCGGRGSATTPPLRRGATTPGWPSKGGGSTTADAPLHRRIGLVSRTQCGAHLCPPRPAPARAGVVHSSPALGRSAPLPPRVRATPTAKTTRATLTTSSGVSSPCDVKCRAAWGSSGMARLAIAAVPSRRSSREARPSACPWRACPPLPPRCIPGRGSGHSSKGLSCATSAASISPTCGKHGVTRAREFVDAHVGSRASLEERNFRSL
jgi:hypothetical protein